jgi:LacI family transcriptional regulator
MASLFFEQQHHPWTELLQIIYISLLDAANKTCNNVTGYKNIMTRKSCSVTIRDVAREAGVSVATISRYINRSAPVSSEIAERIGIAITELNYKPHAVARQLATQKTMSIGLLLTNMYNNFFTPLVSGIEAVVKQKGYNLLVATHQSNSKPNSRLPISANNTDGMIVFANSLNDNEILDLHQDGYPMVLIHRSSPEGYQLPSVTIENKNATRRLVEHLIVVHGRRKILFMCGPDHQEDSYWREIGYIEALEANGLEFDPELVICGGFEREIAYQEIKDFLTKNREFDAVFSGDDDSAIGVINALRESGRRIPEDISIIGFDDLRLSAFLTPPLTTVKAPTELVGRTAAKQLFDLIAGKDVDPITILPTEIVIRRSCGCYA